MSYIVIIIGYMYSICTRHARYFWLCEKTKFLALMESFQVVSYVITKKEIRKIILGGGRGVNSTFLYTIRLTVVLWFFYCIQIIVIMTKGRSFLYNTCMVDELRHVRNFWLHNKTSFFAKMWSFQVENFVIIEIETRKISFFWGRGDTKCSTL